MSLTSGKLVRSLSALGLLLAIASAPATAQATRTWVSGVGDDVNPCSRTAPCKTFAGAISKTAAGGEISALDPGGFGAVTITKSITINGDGTLAGILASLVNGIVVNAGANDKVIIRNVSIAGANNGLDGVRYLAGGQLMLDKVTIYGFQNSANSQAVDVSLTSNGKLIMQDVTITNCEAGVRLTTTAGTLQATLDNVRIENTDLHAVEAFSNTIVTVSRSNISHNFNAGVRAVAATAVINVESSVLAFNNGAAVNAGVAGARVRISDSAILNNTTGISIAAGGFVDSAQNNRVAGNGASTAPNGIITLE